jgi:hypothetical protein
MNLILDPNLAKRWQALFPISEGNQPQQMPVPPTAEQISPVIVLNPSTLIPWTASGSAGGSGNKEIYNPIPLGYHLMVTNFAFWNSVASDSLLFDGGTQVWDLGALTSAEASAVAVMTFPSGMEFKTSVIFNCNNVCTTYWGMVGYLERISNI